MEKFTTILVLGALSAGLFAAPAAADCARDLRAVEAQARSEPDWIRRESVLALLVEARRDAARGQEAACREAVDLARARLAGRG